MSMRDYAVNDYGLVLDEDTIKTIASKVFDDYTDDDDLMYMIYEMGICEYISEFTGEAQEVDGNGFYWGEDGKMYNNDVIAYIQASHYPTLFKKAYDNMDELIDEFKSKVGKYLPDDFDYRNNIRHICGTYYG